ncbi:glycosyltransferase [Rubrivirga sp. IMCC43871]|uniref:glycosyltransferase n=1 Tax=Rubrivirga sp. IMCC43871 TaxID=3391575 RepID=UPI00398F9378
MTGLWEVLLLAVLAIHLGVAVVVVVNLLAFSHGRRLALPATLPSVSVLVPVRNEEGNLATLLPTLLAQRGVDLQIVVVDDASEDGTWGVLAAHADDRLVAVRGSGPPDGWVGKPHALYQAAKRATGEVYVFLDADAQLTDDGALARLVGRYTARGGTGTALTGLPRYLDRGPAALMTSLVPFAVLAALPVPLVPRTAAPSLGALNGQIWVLGAADYARLAPHEAVAAEVLEDVQIGRYLKRSGVRLWFEDLSGEVAVTMYRTFGEAWAGFQKNAALLAGGRPGQPITAGFAVFFALYAFAWVLPSVLWLGGAAGLWALASLVGIKLAIDRAGRFPLWVSALAPVTLALGAALQLDSARVHRSGAVAWKGRRVG